MTKVPGALVNQPPPTTHDKYQWLLAHVSTVSLWGKSSKFGVDINPSHTSGSTFGEQLDRLILKGMGR